MLIIFRASLAPLSTFFCSYRPNLYGVLYSRSAGETTRYYVYCPLRDVFRISFTVKHVNIVCQSMQMIFLSHPEGTALFNCQIFCVSDIYSLLRSLYDSYFRPEVPQIRGSTGQFLFLAKFVSKFAKSYNSQVIFTVLHIQFFSQVNYLLAI